MQSGGSDIKLNGAQEPPQSPPFRLRGKPSPWTADDEANLRRWWDEGFTCSQISTGLGGRFSRNAVIGKIHRLGLDGRATPIRTKAELEERRKRNNAAKYAWKRRTGYVPPSRRKPPPFVPVADELIPLVQRKTLLQLSPRDCRWPVGEPNEPGFFFCGAETDEGRSYCPYHHHVAHMASNYQRARHPLPQSNRETQTRVPAGEGRAQPARSSFAFGMRDHERGAQDVLPCGQEGL